MRSRNRTPSRRFRKGTLRMKSPRTLAIGIVVLAIAYVAYSQMAEREDTRPIKRQIDGLPDEQMLKREDPVKPPHDQNIGLQVNTDLRSETENHVENPDQQREKPVEEQREKPVEEQREKPVEEQEHLKDQTNNLPQEAIETHDDTDSANNQKIENALEEVTEKKDDEAAHNAKGGIVQNTEVQENKETHGLVTGGEVDELTKLRMEVKLMKSALEDMGKRLSYVPNYPTVPRLNYIQRKRILVTGGAGFVGSHLVDFLMHQGHEVTVVDNFFTGRKQNVEHWIGHPNFELIHHDVVLPIYLEVDQIYHLASPASPIHYMENPVKTIKCNTIGTVNMLGLANRVGARLLFASTSEVYGDPSKNWHPQNETYHGNVNPIGPRACYDESKRVGETLCYSYQKQEDVAVRVARIFNTFGPRMHMKDGRVVSNFILQALQGQALSVYNGNQTRSFQYVDDLVQGLVALMNGNYSKPVNLGNPEEHTIGGFAKLIIDLVGNERATLKITSLPKDDPHRRKPDISLAKSKLGWEPKVKMMDGLRKTIDYFRRELELSEKALVDGKTVEEGRAVSLGNPSTTTESKP